MIRLIPDSRSVILRATHITYVRIESIRAPEWTTQPTRTAELTLQIIEVFKGKLTDNPQEVQISIKQTHSDPFGPNLPPRNCWSDQPSAPGTEWMIFSKANVNSPRDVVADPACTRLIPAAEALNDVRRAAKLEAEDPRRVPSALSSIKPEAADLHELFMEYLGARLPELNLEARPNFEAILQLLEASVLSTPARVTLLSAVISYVNSSPKADDWMKDRLAVGMFRLLGLPQAKDLHENLIGTYLPNFLGIGDASGVRTAEQVFRDWPNDRVTARAALERYRGDPHASELLSWIGR